MGTRQRVGDNPETQATLGTRQRARIKKKHNTIFFFKLTDRIRSNIKKKVMRHG